MKKSLKLFILLSALLCASVFALAGCMSLLEKAVDNVDTDKEESCKHITRYISSSVMTCDHDGHEAYYKCQLCNKLFADHEATREITLDDVRIPARHSTKKIEAKPATCTSTGVVECWQCTMCFNYFEDNLAQTPIPRAEAVLAQLEHDYRDFPEQPATCIERGRRAGNRCSVCGSAKTGSDWIPVIDHIFEDGVCTMCHVPHFQLGLKFLPLTQDVDGQTEIISYMVSGVELTYPRVVEIPAEYEGKPVTEILNDAFEDNELITGIYIADTVTTIGARAFVGCANLKFVEFAQNSQVTELPGSCFHSCTSLERIVLPDTLQKIGGYVFYNCALMDISSLPASLTEIGASAFFGCKNVGDINVPASVQSVGEKAFDGCSYAVIRCEANRPEGYDSNIGGDTPVVWDYKNNDVATDGNIYTVFNGVRYKLDGNKAYVMGYRRADGALVTEISIPKDLSYGGAEYSVKGIAKNAFLYCSAVTRIAIEKDTDIEQFERQTFAGCTSLEELELPYMGMSKRISTYQYENILTYMFSSTSFEGGYYVSARYAAGGGYSNCYAPSSFKKITVHGGNIKYGAFGGFTSLEEIVLGSGITQTDSGIFDSNKALKYIAVPGGTAIKNMFATQSFAGGYAIPVAGSNLSNYVPATLERIEITRGNIVDDMFAGFSRVNDFILPDGVTEIGRRAFSGCAGLTRVEIRPGLRKIGEDAYKDCTGLTGVYVNALTDWLGITFGNILSNPLMCAHDLYVNGQKTEEVTVPQGVTSLLPYAFAGFGGSSLTLSEDMASIGMYAFACCSSLTSMTIPSSVTFMDDYILAGCYSLEELTIPYVGTRPDGTGRTELRFMFYNSSNGYTMPTSLKTVNVTGTALYNSAFENCDSITQISLAAGTTVVPKRAFFDCTALKQINLPDSITTIKENAFAGSGIINFVMPQGVTTVEKGILSGCNSLRTVTVPFVGASPTESEASDKTLLGYYFYYSAYSFAEASKQYYASNKYYYARIPASLESVTVTGGKLYYGAFSGIKRLGEIIISEGVTYIGQNIVMDCENLHTVRVENTAPNIELTAFNGCGPAIAYFAGAGTQTYYIPAVYDYQNNGTAADGNSYNRVNGITYGLKPDGTAFVYRQPSSITAAIVPQTVEHGGSSYTVCSIMDGAFRNCTELTEVSLPDTLTALGTGMFEGSTNITTARIPFLGTTESNGLTLMELWGMTADNYNNYKLTDLTVNRGKIVAQAFKDCNKLEKLTIEDASSVGAAAFDGCSRLTELTVLGAIPEMPEGVVAHCNALQKITLPFVGRYQNAAAPSAEAVFSYIFGSVGTNVSSSLYKVYQYFGENTTIDNCYTSAIPVSLTQITIAGGVLNRGAFYGLSRVGSVILGEDITAIVDYAFYGCSSLDFVMPATVRTIGAHAFDGAGNRNILVLENIQSIGEYAFKDNKFPSITLPASLTAIPEGILAGCTNITSVTVPQSVTTIGQKAFMGCTSLTQISLPTHITEFSAYMLAGCTKITSITIPDHITTLGNYAFSGSGLTQFTLPDRFTVVPVGLLSDCASLTSVTLHSGVTQIMAYAFSNSGLTSISVPAGVTAIPYYAFEDCTALSSVTLQEGLLSIGQYSFYGCTALKTLAIPASVTTLSNYAFAASGIEQISIPGGSEFTIGDYSFRNCRSLRTFTATAKNVGSNAFEGCTMLSSCAITGLMTIGYEAFKGCTALSSFDFSTVTSLTQSCFENSGITSVDLPNVLTVASYSFKNCKSLASVSLGAATAVNEGAFYGCNALSEISFGNSGRIIQSIGKEAFYQCGFTEITLGNSLNFIGQNAFVGGKLKTVTLVGGNNKWTVRLENNTTVNDVELTATSLTTGNFAACVWTR